MARKKKKLPKYAWTVPCWRQELSGGVVWIDLFRYKRDAVKECETCLEKYSLEGRRCRYRLKKHEPKKIGEVDR